MGRTIRLGRIFNIEFDLDWSWFVIFALVTWSLAEHYMTVHQDWSTSVRWSLAILTAVLFFASVLAHELAHSVISKREGIPVPRITLYLFGGASEISQQPRRARDEFWMALVGPLTSLLLAGVFGVVWYITLPRINPSMPYAVLNELSGWLVGINLMLGIFNLLPGFPLDGGRVLRSVVWGITKSVRRATQVAVFAGVLLSWLMIGTGVWLVLQGDWSDGLWIAFLGWFLQGASEREGRSTIVHDILRGHTLREVPLSNCLHVLPQVSLDVFLENTALTSGQRCFAVTQGDKVLGFVTLRRLQAVPRDQWKTTRLSQIMIPPDKLASAQLDEELTTVLETLERGEGGQMPVFDRGQFVGIVTHADILSFLRSRAQLQRQAGTA